MQDIIIGRKGWLEYLYAVIFYCAFGFVIYKVSTQFRGINSKYIFYAYAACFSLFVYRLAVLRSYRISINDEGIWLNYGILPWSLFGNGIRWRDADMAYYYPNFISWISNCYAISVNHKYTNQIDFKITSVWRGRKVAAIIQDEIRSRI